MRSKLMTALTVIGAVTVLVLAANSVALATTGHAILAGKINTATKMTSITRTTPGTGLQVRTKKTTDSPLAVNGTGKVVNLNADKVDGYDGGTRALTWTYTGAVTKSSFALTGFPAGTYLITYEMFMQGLTSDDGVPVNCYLTAGGAYGGESDSAESGSYYPSFSATARMTLAAGSTLKLNCNVESGATWTAPYSEPVRVTAIPLAGTTDKGAPTMGRVAGHAKQR